MIASATQRTRRAFTLVELLTVMGILGILVALVVGAAYGIRRHAARTETEQTLGAIQSGLSKYFDDWHKYPWYDDDNQWMGGSFHPLTGQVRGGTRDESGYRPLDVGDKSRGDPASACLYASMAMRERNGPYYTGSGGNTASMAFQDEDKYTVFTDGWGRPIRYFQPPPKPPGQRPAGAAQGDTVFYRSTPLLMSEGPEKDMPGIAETKEDNMYNYPVESPPDDGKYLN